MFLESMSQFYELHIFTFGARNYAHMIAQLLDPDGKFFSHRILSRDECFNATSKTDNLKRVTSGIKLEIVGTCIFYYSMALFPNGDSMVCIIDDREDVWNMDPNLIQVKPYHFFQHTGDINAPPGLFKHEFDGEDLDFKDLKNMATDKALPSEDKDKSKENCVAEAAFVDTPAGELDTKSEDILNSNNETDQLVAKLAAIF